MTVQSRSVLALSLCIAFFLFEFVARIEPGLAIADIADDFDLSNASAGTMASLFFWIYAPMQLVVGILLDKYGARPLVIPAIITCSLGVLIFGLTDSVLLAALGRLLTGLGASFAFVGALYVVNHRFSPQRFALLSGLVNTVGMLGTAVGAVLLADVIAAQGWRAVFVMTGAVGLCLAVLMFFTFQADPTDMPKHQDDDKLANDLIPILTNGRIWAIALAGALFYMPVNVFGGLWGQSDLTLDHGLDPVSAEIAVSMVFAGMAVGSIGAGALSDWIGHRKWIIAISAVLCAATYGVAIYAQTASVMVLGGALFGAGVFSGAQMLTYAMAKEGWSNAQAGKVIAFVNMIGIAAAIVFQPLIGGLIDITNHNYRLALSTVPICALCAAVLILFVQDVRHPDHEER